MTNNNYCRLCGGQLSTRFNLTVLHKHEVSYYICQECQSLQTENPYWLIEAYQHSLSNLDTGAAQRVLRNLAACYSVAKLFGVKNVIDIGGGDGLLCRLLRDYGINCFVKDKYAEPSYAQGFTEPNFGVADLILAFEVFEHFQNPKSDLDAFFALGSNLFLVSTCVYKNEQHDWWYLSPEGGQHVFFYSKKALQLIALKYGYELIICGSIILFARGNVLNRAKLLFAKLLLNRYSNRILRSVVVLLPTQGVWRDHLLKKAKMPATPSER
jgi:Methyltransferase domain